MFGDFELKSYGNTHLICTKMCWHCDMSLPQIVFLPLEYEMTSKNSPKLGYNNKRPKLVLQFYVSMTTKRWSPFFLRCWSERTRRSPKVLRTLFRDKLVTSTWECILRKRSAEGKNIYVLFDHSFFTLPSNTKSYSNHIIRKVEVQRYDLFSVLLYFWRVKWQDYTACFGVTLTSMNAIYMNLSYHILSFQLFSIWNVNYIYWLFCGINLQPTAFFDQDHHCRSNFIS